MIKQLFAIGFFSIVLVACTSEGGTNNPLVRPFEWFSYANGDDIRTTCEPGTVSRYRLIYNGLYDEQIRTYNISQWPGSKEAEQTTRVFKGTISTDWSISSSGLDIAGTYTSKKTISLKDLVAIEQALIAEGFEKPAITGQILHSDEFYWIAMVCRDGIFKYYAWTEEYADVAKLPFREVLSKGDETGVAFLEPYVPIQYSRNSRYYSKRGQGGSTYFTMQVGDNGLDL
jgi:hypothetical protein